jgi:hypothetical protein
VPKPVTDAANQYHRHDEAGYVQSGGHEEDQLAVRLEHAPVEPVTLDVENLAFAHRKVSNANATFTFLGGRATVLSAAGTETVFSFEGRGQENRHAGDRNSI